MANNQYFRAWYSKAKRDWGWFLHADAPTNDGVIHGKFNHTNCVWAKRWPASLGRWAVIPLSEDENKAIPI